MARIEKRVRFADKHKISMFYKDDSDESAWFTSRSIRKAKKHYFKEGKAWQLKGYGVLLVDCFQNPIQERLDAFCQLPDDDNFRGTESYLSDNVAKDRYLMKRRALQAVVDREITLKLDRSRTPDEIAEELRVVSEKHTKFAREFALKMGKADEAASRDEGSAPNVALGLVKKLSAKEGYSSSLSESVMNIGNDWFLSSMKNMIVGRQA